MTAATAAAPAIARICAAIGGEGLAVVPGFLPRPALAALAAEAHRRDAAGEFRAAGVGRGERRIERADFRGDRIAWLDQAAPAAAEIPFRSALEGLRRALNQSLFLGLFAFEGHYAIYPPGARYGRHRDRFRDDVSPTGERVLSCVLYLNAEWAVADGGALRIHFDDGTQRDVLPEGGTLVCFLAERFDHEVLPALRERLALTGWFRRRA